MQSLERRMAAGSKTATSAPAKEDSPTGVPAELRRAVDLLRGAFGEPAKTRVRFPSERFWRTCDETETKRGQGASEATQGGDDDPRGAASPSVPHGGSVEWRRARDRSRRQAEARRQDHVLSVRRNDGGGKQGSALSPPRQRNLWDP